jgi:hypothetical protein
MAGDPYHKSTSTEDDGGDGGKVDFLDRLHVDCGAGAAIAQFHYSRVGYAPAPRTSTVGANAAAPRARALNKPPKP